MLTTSTAASPEAELKAQHVCGLSFCDPVLEPHRPYCGSAGTPQSVLLTTGIYHCLLMVLEWNWNKKGGGGKHTATAVITPKARKGLALA